MLYNYAILNLELSESKWTGFVFSMKWFAVKQMSRLLAIRQLP